MNADATLPYEMALSELIDKIVPGLDSGDILADAKAASAALSTPPAPRAPSIEQAGERAEPVAWLPYLSDRADGVLGHYAIARWNPAGFREVWNLRRHHWGAFSDEVLTLDQALALLQAVTIPAAEKGTP